MYDAVRFKQFKAELEPYASSPQSAMQIVTALERVGIYTLADAAVHGDAGLLKVRGIGPMNLQTIRDAWKGQNDRHFKREFMLRKLQSQRTAINEEILALSRDLEEVLRQIDALMGETQ